MTIERYQNVVIGSGEAGKILAWNLAKMGQKTVVIERAMIGGSCPNIACLPSKYVIYGAKAVSLVDPDKGLGIVTCSVRVDMSRPRCSAACRTQPCGTRSLHTRLPPKG